MMPLWKVVLEISFVVSGNFKGGYCVFEMKLVKISVYLQKTQPLLTP